MQKLIEVFFEKTRSHLLVILIFFVLTCFLTFPVIANFGDDIAGFFTGDPQHMLWRFWLMTYSLDNSLDPFQTNLIFHPDGVTILHHNIFSTSIGSFLLNFLELIPTWNTLVFFGFIFGGYGCYLLANYFTRSFIPSIISGIIFTFSTYHFIHSAFHIGLVTIVWIPIYILYLFKISESRSMINPIICGVLLFLVTSSHFYYTFSITIFSVIFAIVFVFKNKTIDNKIFFRNLSIALGLGLALSLILFLPTIQSSNDQVINRPVSEHIEYSLSLEDFLSPYPLQTINFYSDFVVPTSIYDFFGQTYDTVDLERYAYVGFSIIILSIIGLIWFRSRFSFFWLLITGIFAVLCLGPELKIFNELTGLSLPYLLFYEIIPGWDFFRVPSRFIVIVTLSMAILSSFAIVGITKKYFSSLKKSIVLGVLIIIIISVELSTIPGLSSEVPPIPEIYDTIKSDTKNTAILEVPVGGFGQMKRYSDPIFQYYQTYHEKPIVGGYEVHTTSDIQRGTQEYFYNNFSWDGSKSDVVNQDLSKVGISIMNYLNVGHVLIHQKTFSNYDTGDEYFTLSSKVIPNVTSLMQEILGKTESDYASSELIYYKIPTSTSNDPFILLGKGWYPLDYHKGNLVRYAEPTSEIILVNPDTKSQNVNLRIQMQSFIDDQNINLKINEINQIFPALSSSSTEVLIENITLLPGSNSIIFISENFTNIDPKIIYKTMASETILEKEFHISHLVYSISLER